MNTTFVGGTADTWVIIGIPQGRIEMKSSHIRDKISLIRTLCRLLFYSCFPPHKHSHKCVISEHKVEDRRGTGDLLTAPGTACKVFPDRQKTRPL